MPLFVHKPLVGFVDSLFAESLAESVGKQCGIDTPPLYYIIMNIFNRTILCISGIHDKNGREAKKLSCIYWILVARTTQIPLAFKRTVHVYEDKQAYRQRIVIGVFVRQCFPFNNFRCHIACFPQNTHIGTIRCHIVIITNQDITGLWVNEKVPVIHILIT